MKKIKYLVLLLICILVGPMMVKAETNELVPVNVHIFKSSTCQYCQMAIEFFEDLEKDSEYGEYFELKTYETNGSSAEIQENINLAEKVAKYFGESFGSIPLIVIGDKNYVGYASSMDDSLKDRIKSCYEDQCEDVVLGIQNGTLKTSNLDTIIIVAIFVVLIGGISYFIYIARKNPEDTNVNEKEEVVEEKKLTNTKKANTSKSVSKKSSSTKKKTSNKKK